MTTAISVTPFINVMLWVKLTDEGTYDVRYEPVAPLIVQPDTVINYQIVETYGQDIVFSGVEVTPPDLDQISSAVSCSGKLLTVNDANTYKGWLSLNLEFTDKTRQVKFNHDPQVRNDPQI